MKKFVSIALFIFFAVIIVILIGSLFSSGQNQGIPETSSSPTTTPVSIAPPVEVSPGTKTIGLAEVAKHRSASDCWQAISGNVYDFSPYLDQHPAGAETMIPYCGKDSTQAYDTKGGRGDSHSGKAERMLPTYFVGRLSQ